MTAKSPSHSMDDVLDYLNQFAGKGSTEASKAMFYFLYKEILVNRISILEANPATNRAAIEHNEKVINDLNMKLMEQMEHQKA